jgi:outer membrane biosynthesis protein TonB
MLIAWLFVVAWPPRSAHAQASPLIILTSVQVLRDGQTAFVSIEADGPLPQPATGALDSPPRFFLDFPGVIAGTRGTAGDGQPLVSRVRVALHSASPPVTRVVIDLARPQPVKVEAEGREAGRIRVVVGGPGEVARPEVAAPPREAPSTPALIPVPPLPPETAVKRSPPSEPPLPPQDQASSRPVETSPPTKPQPQPSMPQPEQSKAAPPPAKTDPAAVRPDPGAAAPPPVYAAGPSRAGAKPAQSDIDRYKEQIGVALNQLRGRRTLLTVIDQQDPKPQDGLAAARAEFSAVIRSLAGVRPAATMLSTHDVLVRAASLALMAATLRDDLGGRADPSTIRNASSAAAGALLLLDRVCIEIGCGPLPEVK